MKACIICGEPTDNPEKVCQECRKDVPDDASQLCVIVPKEQYFLEDMKEDLLAFHNIDSTDDVKEVVYFKDYEILAMNNGTYRKPEFQTCKPLTDEITEYATLDELIFAINNEEEFTTDEEAGIFHEEEEEYEESINDVMNWGMPRF